MCGRGRYALLAERRVARERRQAEQQNRQDAGRNNVMGYVNNEGGNGGEQDRVENNAASVEAREAPASSNAPVIENLSPGWIIPIIVEKNNQRDVIPMTWGMIPNYEDISEKPNHFKLFNKRIETLHGKGYFRKLLETRRCVIVLDGFYEWKTTNGVKQPNYVCYSGKDRPLLCAGIYEYSRKLSPTGDVITFPTFSMITGEPSAKFSCLHNREPALLTEEQMKVWLNGQSDVDMLLQLLINNSKKEEEASYKSIQFYPVTNKMSVTRYQDSDCSLPISKEEMMTSTIKKESSSKSNVVKSEVKNEKLEEQDNNNVKSPDTSNSKKRPAESPASTNTLTKYFKSAPSPSVVGDVIDLTDD